MDSYILFVTEEFKKTTLKTLADAMMNKTHPIHMYLVPDADGLDTIALPMTNHTQTNQEFSVADLVCYKYIGPAICIFGIICNILSLWVLSKGHLGDSYYLQMKTLAITDAAALILSFPFMMFCIQTQEYFWRWYEIYIFLPLVNFFTASSVWITVIMTIERFIFVKYPLWARWNCSKYNTRFRIWIVITLAIVINIPRFFCYEIVTYDNSLVIYPTLFRDSEFYYAMDIFCITILHFIPLLIFSVLNSYLVLKLGKAKIFREEISLTNNIETTWHRDQRRLTVTLVSIVVLSIVSMIPAAVADIFLYAMYSPSRLRLLRNIGNLLLWCNLSFNFILQCMFNKHFLRVSKDTIGRRLSQVKRIFRATSTTSSVI